MIERIEKLSLKEGKSIQELGLKLSEETGETAQAILSATNASGCEYKAQTMSDVKEEAADVTLVALSIFFKAGGNMNELKETINKKADKWERVSNDRF